LPSHVFEKLSPVKISAPNATEQPEPVSYNTQAKGLSTAIATLLLPHDDTPIERWRRLPGGGRWLIRSGARRGDIGAIRWTSAALTLTRVMLHIAQAVSIWCPAPARTPAHRHHPARM